MIPTIDMTSKDENCERPGPTQEDDQSPTQFGAQETEMDSNVNHATMAAAPVNDDDIKDELHKTKEVHEQEVERDSSVKPEEMTAVSPAENRIKDEHLDSKEVSEQEAESDVTHKKTEAIEGTQEGSRTESEPEDGFIDLLGNGQLKKKVVKPGKPNTRPMEKNVVKAKVKVYLEDGTCVQDSTETFVHGDGDVIQAIDMMVAMMDESEIATVIAAPRFAYGSYGREPDIPPNATLTLEIKVLEVLPSLDMTKLSAEDILKHGERKREQGNVMFKREEYSMAISAYSRALKYFEARERGLTADTAVLQQILDSELKCHNNMAASQLKIGAFDAVIRSCSTVLKTQPDNVKALYRMGKAYYGRGDTAKAIETLKKAINLDPSSKLLHKDLAQWTEKRKREVESEKNMYRKMLGSMADAASAGKKNGSDKSIIKMTLIVGGIMAAVFSVGFACYRMSH